MYVKVCGLTDPATVDVAVDAGADAIGVVMNQTSSRAVAADVARTIVDRAAGRVDTVLVVNDMPAVDAARIAADLGFSVLQLHGSYTADDFTAASAVFARLWRATSLANDPPLQVGAYGEENLLLDAPRPGSGERWDLSVLADLGVCGRWLLAGGLSPTNVADAVGQVRPWGVDVSSGVESSPGVKDHAKVRAFVEAARRAGTSLT
ncbi:phosphoribosylanthranilate isomerase [Gordonia sp. HY002]|uniref:phosphoribosylanthranilate isomerase n=1 Tax=Gordonia zhenghanii TaxID=2911516 RepID=UPI001EEFAF18|nr:phosphoribosylanthranilate isomerase [Gordonia zhenghanii]MCF8572076.1 phosphoribosylanthranilate isomerase [Gordonia zhenghanii]MCF8602950.1 phosphoribosylanthranilate isomerase [Gordonia zhenghanii]MCF8605680.1 phosphoribosylanthranilate isomerase [Gordonia zhenghanii]